MSMEDNYEIPEELTPAEIAELLNNRLDSDTCSDIEECESPEEAIGLAITALTETGIENPLDLLKTLGLIEDYDEDES